MEHKVIKIAANQKVKERCPVYLLDLYFSKLPVKAKESNVFCSLLIEVYDKDSDDPWFSAVPISRNMLQCMVRDMCQETV